MTQRKTSHKGTMMLLVDRVVERRRAGDNRPLQQIIAEVTKDITLSEAKRNLERHVRDLFLRKARTVFGLAGPKAEVNLALPFPTGDIGKYRTQPLVRVFRAGAEDFVAPTLVTGSEIQGHDKWEVFQRKRQLAHTTKRRKENEVHTKELEAIGFNPATQTNYDMHKQGDIRICRLCGEGPLAGDPWEVDHETPVVVSEGKTQLGWTHCSCNRSKGATEVDHIAPEPR